MKRINILIISFFITVSFTGCREDQITLEVLDEVDYELYSLILDDSWRYLFNISSNIDEFTVKHETTNWLYESLTIDQLPSWLKDSFPVIDISVFTDYISKNKTILYFDSIKFQEAGKVVALVNQQAYIDNGRFSWTTFYEEYPNSDGVMIFRRIGYNSDKSQAIVEFEHVPGNGTNGGQGFIIYLAKNNNNEWEIIKWVMRWIS